MIREVYARTQGRRVKIFHQDQRDRVLSELLFAGEAVLAAESASQLQYLLIEFGRVCRRRESKVNVVNETNSWW